MNHLKISPEDAYKIKITSDLHFNHKNIVKGVTSWKHTDICREFETLEHHNEYLIHILNKHIEYDDIHICVGDWSFGGFEWIKKLWDRLECHNIHFVLGNHDQHIESNKENIQELFLSVQDRLHINIGDKDFVIQHMPLETWDHIFKGWMHLFGHQHSDRVGPGRKMDVGIDKYGTLREPYTIDEILSILESIEIVGGKGDSTIEVETKTKRLK